MTVSFSNLDDYNIMARNLTNAYVHLYTAKLSHPFPTTKLYGTLAQSLPEKDNNENGVVEIT